MNTFVIFKRFLQSLHRIFLLLEALPLATRGPCSVAEDNLGDMLWLTSVLATNVGLVLPFPDRILVDDFPDRVGHRDDMCPIDDRLRLLASKGEVLSKTPELCLLDTNG